MCAKTKIILSPSIMRTNSPSSVSQFPSSFESDDAKQSILIISENMPPQVNGIARRIGMYAEGLRDKGCNVGKRYFCYCNHDRCIPYSLTLICIPIHTHNRCSTS